MVVSQNLQMVVADLESSVVHVYQMLFKVMEQENIESLDAPVYLRFILLHQPEHYAFQSIWQNYKKAFSAFVDALGKEHKESELDYELINASLNECLDLDVFKVLYMQKVYGHFQLDFTDIGQQLHTQFYFFNPRPQEKYLAAEDVQNLRSRSCTVM